MQLSEMLAIYTSRSTQLINDVYPKHGCFKLIFNLNSHIPCPNMSIVANRGIATAVVAVNTSVGVGDCGLDFR